MLKKDVTTADLIIEKNMFGLFIPILMETSSYLLSPERIELIRKVS
jgi:hypothetical protein